MKIFTSWCLNPTFTLFSLKKISLKEKKKKKKKSQSKKWREMVFLYIFPLLFFLFKYELMQIPFSTLRCNQTTLGYHQNFKCIPLVLLCQILHIYMCDSWKIPSVTCGASSIFLTILHISMYDIWQPLSVTCGAFSTFPTILHLSMYEIWQLVVNLYCKSNNKA